MALIGINIAGVIKSATGSPEFPVNCWAAPFDGSAAVAMVATVTHAMNNKGGNYRLVAPRRVPVGDLEALNTALPIAASEHDQYGLMNEYFGI